jgi:5-methylcytosine-specific restriction endonuclease McrA
MTDADSKRCAKCKTWKPLIDFGSGKKWSDGKFPYCRPCKRLSDKADREKHKDARQAAARARYLANVDFYKAKSRARYRANPDDWKAKALAWQRANPEKRKVINAAWQQRNLHGFVREATRRRYARRKGAVAIVFTKAQLEQRMAYWGDCCWCCGGPRQAVDHVKPLSRGGAHMLCNLRPVCWSCNSSKSDAWPVDTRRRAAT